MTHADIGWFDSLFDGPLHRIDEPGPTIAKRYADDQPRVPAGEHGGGQFASADGGSGGATLSGSKGTADPEHAVKQGVAFLRAEAAKYGTAREFISAFNAQHLIDLSDRDHDRWGRAIASFASEREMVDDIAHQNEIGWEMVGGPETIKGDAYYRDVARAIFSPSDSITIYRGVPKSVGEIEIGDFVALTRDYADTSGEGNNPGNSHVLAVKVPKADVVWGGADLAEWAYSPRALRDAVPSLEELWHQVHGSAPARSVRYSDDQPRVPAGQHGGGEFASADGTTVAGPDGWKGKEDAAAWFAKNMPDTHISHLIPERGVVEKMHLEHLRQFAKAWERVGRAYPGILPLIKITSLSVRALGPHVYADWRGKYSVGMMEVSTKTAMQPNGLAKALKSDVASGWHPEGCDTFQSVIEHELGHGIGNYLTWRGIGPRDQYTHAAIDLSSRSPSPSGAGYGKWDCAYAKQNAAEWFAEQFSAGLANGEPLGPQNNWGYVKRAGA